MERGDEAFGVIAVGYVALSVAIAERVASEAVDRCDARSFGIAFGAGKN